MEVIWRIPPGNNLFNKASAVSVLAQGTEGAELSGRRESRELRDLPLLAQRGHVSVLSLGLFICLCHW